MTRPAARLVDFESFVAAVLPGRDHPLLAVSEFALGDLDSIELAELAAVLAGLGVDPEAAPIGADCTLDQLYEYYVGAAIVIE